MELDDANIQKLATCLAQAIGDRRTSRATGVERLMTGAIGVLSIVSLIFSLGVNWSRIGSLEKLVGGVNVPALQLQVDAQGSDVRKLTEALNAVAISNAVIVEQLKNIQRDLSDLKASQR